MRKGIVDTDVYTNTNEDSDKLQLFFGWLFKEAPKEFHKPKNFLQYRI
jgi:hypothetical protein